MSWPALPLKRLVDPARSITYGIVQAGPDTPGGIPYIRPVDMSASAGVPDPMTLLRTTHQIADSYNRSSVKPGDLVVSIGPSYGKLMIVPRELAGANLTQGTARVAASETVSTRFLYWALQTAMARQFWDASVGGATFRALNLEPLGRTPVPIPPLDEQRRIADFLDMETGRIHQLVNLQQNARTLINERDHSLRDGLVDHLAISVGEIPLRRFAMKVEQGASPQCDTFPREEESDWGVLKLSAIKRGHFNPSENKRLPSEVEPNKSHEVQRGDLLVSRANTPALVGDAAVVGSDHAKLLLPDLIYRVVLSPGMDAKYVAQVALSGRVRTLIESVARGSSQSMVKLRGEDIKNWPIPAASSAQQAEVVKEIERETGVTERLRNATSSLIRLLAERRQALITAAVTGQFDVSTASGRNVTDGV
ncbi:restriction endonuclease subunit S [Streptomyces cyaneofuscatus]|uniref:restriction endonuclease subunit S n=1 Tax=Streptomyces cyaneofuscatus TaxID=66883 RepID=UPI0036B3E274